MDNPKKRYGAVTLFVILIAATIGIIAYVMANGSNPIGPSTPSGGSSISGEDDLTPVIGTIVALNAGTGLQGVNSGAGRFTLNVITPTPQPTATPGAGGATALNVGLPILAGGDPTTTIYIGVPGKGLTSTGGGEFMVASDIYYEPFNVSEEITLHDVFFLVTSAGAAGNACRVGIYEADDDDQATDLVVDVGQIINDTTGWKTADAGDVVMSPGKYVSATICNSAPALGDHVSHSYISGAVSSGTTSATRFVRKLRDAAPTGDPYTNGFANPGDSPFDTIDLGNGGSFVHFILMRWSVN